MTKLTPILAAGLALSLTLSATLAHSQQAQVATNFQQADANGDGALTASEFTTFINLNAQYDIGRAKMIQKRNAYSTAFGRIDRNSDGYVTTDEMAALAQ